MEVTRRQNGNNEEPQHTEQHVVRGQITDGHDGVRVRDNNAGVFQPHHADKQPDTGGNAHTQADRNIGNHPVTDAENSQQQQTHSTPEYRAHTDLPGNAHCADDHKREERIQAHRRCQCDRLVGDHAHQDAAERGNQAGGHEHGLFIHPRNTQDLRVHENDIDHGQEGS
ncbi:hypothetical protein SRABI106_00566 [Rahnella aquatilis]|nr:hypothetical protein SRABI106_00566 [Rahnella aquatilis]